MARTFDVDQLRAMDFSAFPQIQHYPAMQFFPKEWLTGQATRAMSAEQRGGFIDLLAEAWDQKPPASLPNDPQQLANYSRIGSARWAKVGPLVLQQFVVCRDDRLRNPKQVSVWLDMLHTSEKRRGSKHKTVDFVSTTDWSLLPPVLPAPDADADCSSGLGSAPAEIGEGYQPSAEDREWARSECHMSDAETDAQTLRFVRHHRAKGSRFKRPDLAWRNWISGRFIGGGKPLRETSEAPVRETPEQERRDAILEAARELKRRGEAADYLAWLIPVGGMREDALTREEWEARKVEGVTA